VFTEASALVHCRLEADRRKATVSRPSDTDPTTPWKLVEAIPPKRTPFKLELVRLSSELLG
jgi:hypothetical protein